MFVVRSYVVDFNFETDRKRNLALEFCKTYLKNFVALDDRIVAIEFCRIFVNESSIFSDIRDAVRSVDESFENCVSIVSSSVQVRYSIKQCENFELIGLLEAGELEMLPAGALDLLYSQHNSFGFKIANPINEKRALLQLAKRPQVARMFAFAFNSDDYGSRLSQFVRVFESAFGLNHNKLRKPLYRFLHENGLGYERDEVYQWIKLRHEIQHANDPKKIRSFDTDARMSFERLKQAALDVILHKKNWGTTCQLRESENFFVNKFSIDPMDATKFHLMTTLGFEVEASTSDNDPFSRYDSVKVQKKKFLDEIRDGDEFNLMIESDVDISHKIYKTGLVMSV